MIFSINIVKLSVSEIIVISAITAPILADIIRLKSYWIPQKTWYNITGIYWNRTVFETMFKSQIWWATYVL